MKLVKKTLLISSLALLGTVASTSFAATVNIAPTTNNASNAYENSCEDLMDRAYNESVEREGNILNSAQKSIGESFESFSNKVKNSMNGCLNKVKDFKISAQALPGADMIINSVVNAAVGAAESACNGVVDQTTGVVNGQINKYINAPINNAKGSFSKAVGGNSILNDGLGRTIRNYNPVNVGFGK